MKKHLAVDAGGTKVLAILYDDNFRLLAACRTGSMRSNTTSASLIQKNVESLLAGLGLVEGEDCNLSRVTGILDGGLSTRLQEIGTVERIVHSDEMDMGLCAAEIFGDGILALCGTGATFFARHNGTQYIGGGYGAAVSDEGSGYWMAKNAFWAAIKDFEDRGPRTILTDMIAERFGYTRDRLNAAIFSIYRQTENSPVACVAFCAPLVVKAAEMGDAVAIDIVRETGRALGDQTNSLIRKHSLPGSLPLTISGGMWRNNPLMMETFVQTVRKESPERELRIPAFEPIMGLIIGHYYEMYNKFDVEDRERFTENFGEYIYRI